MDSRIDRHETWSEFFPAVFHKSLDYIGANAETVSGRSQKYWEIAVLDLRNGRFATVTCWGRHGRKPTWKAIEGYSRWNALDAAKDMVRKKRRKGYRELDMLTRFTLLVDED